MFDLRWKAACGFTVGTKGFHPSTLTYWRRLAAGDRPHLIFDKVREVIGQTGVLTGKHRRALDSTVLDDAVARQDTVTQLIASIRPVARDVDGADVVVAKRDPAGSVDRCWLRAHRETQIAWDDEQAQQELVSALVKDALVVLAGLDLPAIAKETDNEAAQQAVALLALVAGQDGNRPRARMAPTDGGASRGQPRRIG